MQSGVKKFLFLKHELLRYGGFFADIQGVEVDSCAEVVSFYSNQIFRLGERVLADNVAQDIVDDNLGFHRVTEQAIVNESVINHGVRVNLMEDNLFRAIDRLFFGTLFDREIDFKIKGMVGVRFTECYILGRADTWHEPRFKRYLEIRQGLSGFYFYDVVFDFIIEAIVVEAIKVFLSRADLVGDFSDN